ncbi:MAG: hypothetical protein B7Y99_02605 [Caulobacterales bacterium 32-69-10]|nr:MAG: hypothetical protein B7Y99_02605 [Caulobacterales bacterium 32-69-10]
MDLTAEELAFLRFCAEDPKPSRFNFRQRQPKAPATLQAVKMQGEQIVTSEIGPVGMKKLMPMFDKDMTLTAAAILYLQGLVEA